jgi:hypothetical protein
MSDSLLTWPKVLAGGFVVITACIGATYQLVNLSCQSQIAALKEQVATAALHVSTANLRSEIQDKRVVELERRIEQLVASGNSVSSKETILPLDSSAIPSVRITSPANGAYIGAFVDVHANIAGLTGGAAKPVLFVRDPIGQWWPWGNPQGDTWYGVQIGLAIDKGKQFELRVVVTDQNFERGKPQHVAPQGLAISSVNVIRK